MRELFEAIDNCEAGSVNMVLTALDGEYLGEKALVSDGKLIWESNEEGFFSKYEEAVCQMQDSGVVTIGDSPGCSVTHWDRKNSWLSVEAVMCQCP